MVYKYLIVVLSGHAVLHRWSHTDMLCRTLGEAAELVKHLEGRYEVKLEIYKIGEKVDGPILDVL